MILKNQQTEGTSASPRNLSMGLSDDLRTMLATYYTLSKDNASTPEEMRQKSREHMLMKPKNYSYSENENMQGGSQLRLEWSLKTN